MKERDGEGSKRGLRIKHDYRGLGGEGRVKDAGKTMNEGVGPLLMGRSWDPELGDRARNVGSQTRVCACTCTYTCTFKAYWQLWEREGVLSGELPFSLRSGTKLSTVWGGEGLGGRLKGSDKVKLREGIC